MHEHDGSVSPPSAQGRGLSGYNDATSTTAAAPVGTGLKEKHVIPPAPPSWHASLQRPVRTVPVPPDAEPRAEKLSPSRGQARGQRLPSKSALGSASSCLQNCLCRDIAMHNASNYAATTEQRRLKSATQTVQRVSEP